MSELSYPKKAIVAVTAHGAIEVDETGRPTTFIPPRGMKITKLSAVTPGVCNLMNPEVDADYYVKMLLDNLEIIEESKQSTNPRTNSTVMKELGDGFREADLETTVRDEEENIRYAKKRKVNPNAHSEAYLHHSDKSYQSTVYVKTPVINKYYSRKAEEALKSNTPWDFTITVLNMTGFPDLLREMPVRSNRTDVIMTLEMICNFLYSNGVRELILVDFSCSTFLTRGEDSTDPQVRELSPIDARALRRELLKSGLHGGKKRKTKKPKKGGRRKRKTIKR
jgi:hypothetical protein